jgi:hypothetical protein
MPSLVFVDTSASHFEVMNIYARTRTRMTKSDSIWEGKAGRGSPCLQETLQHTDTVKTAYAHWQLPNSLNLRGAILRYGIL